MTVTNVVIQQGAPGSGKSYGAEKLKERYGCMLVVSADHFHIDSWGEYRWKAENQAAAHQDCFQRFITSLMWRQHDLIVVDNTNVKLWEMSPYVRVAQAFNCAVELHTYRCPPEVGFKRNLHGVPADTIERMAQDLESPPKYWGVKHIVHEYKPGGSVALNPLKDEPFRYGDGIEVPK